MAEHYHPIKVVVQRTGLTAHVIRVWERRYGAVKPKRTGSNRRVYSGEEIARLSLLRQLVKAGQGIGQVAGLSTAKLKQLAAENSGLANLTPAASGAPEPLSMVEEGVDAIRNHDGRQLEALLDRAESERGGLGMLQQVVAPLLTEVGDLWRAGQLTSAHEHFASGVIRMFLGRLARPFALAEGAPVLVVATPAGQLHELGALLAGAAAAMVGWRVIYLGASLPAAEISGVARQNHAKAVALSLVYPEDDPQVADELVRLRRLLPIEVAIVSGGRAVPAYREAVEKIGARQAKDIPQFCAVLDDLRGPGKRARS